ncbi:hypothetical protein FA13DRAFT_689554 [Coprinellus micaceus]|jgi:hypothetical protein|uniref:Uncharacterized protein n=1 Tax=Coprinellus micaceus TaxID=71717 RepID=A0A4Y7T565_COPMI|nr:hypothetical protein FA13DRAFT_689554 [Coprinellus micaceus]
MHASAVPGSLTCTRGKSGHRERSLPRFICSVSASIRRVQRAPSTPDWKQALVQGHGSKGPYFRTKSRITRVLVYPELAFASRCGRASLSRCDGLHQVPATVDSSQVATPSQVRSIAPLKKVGEQGLQADAFCQAVPGREHKSPKRGEGR